MKAFFQFISTSFYCLLLLFGGGCAPFRLTIGNTSPEKLKIDRVFFAQNHVQEPGSPYFKLVGSMPTLIKVQVYSETGAPAPVVIARLDLDSKTLDLPLCGPKTLPRRPTCDPVLMPQSYTDSFTAMIPKEWVRTGLKVTVELRDYDYLGLDADDNDYTHSVSANRIKILDRQVLNDLTIGAPTQLVMQMFDIHYFGGGVGADLPQGWQSELQAKLPVAKLVVHRARGLMFNEIVMPPMFDKPSGKYTSLADFKQRTGHDYDGEQGVALRWGSALKAAGGRHQFWRPYHMNICGVHAGGQGGGYRSCGSIHRHGVIIHELGHSFGLPHWIKNKDYPYKRTMYGQDQGKPTVPNAGPVWAFDMGRADFIAPRRMVGGKLVWTKDPMQGGGKSGLKDYMFKHFSDYSDWRMQKRFENQGVYWNAAAGNYAQWDQTTGAYDKVVENDGVLLPLERDVQVISLLASANVVVPEANIIYSPIGPYTGGLIRMFHADSPVDRLEAQKFGYSDAHTNVCLRVTQGGKVSTYIMRAGVSPDDDPMKVFNASAINLPARDGAITRAELLYCPNVISKGITPAGRVLYSVDF